MQNNSLTRTSESGPDLVEGCGQNIVVGGRRKTGEAHHLGPVLEGFL